MSYFECESDAIRVRRGLNLKVYHLRIYTNAGRIAWITPNNEMVIAMQISIAITIQSNEEITNTLL
jgi:hypothetical protein